jgi:hypothetical protein
MKRVLSPLFISLMLAAGWAQSQPATGDVRESTDPSRAAEVEQKARRLGDSVSPAEPAGGASTQSDTSSGSSGAGTSSGGSDSGMGASGSPTGTEDMSGAQQPYGPSTGSSSPGAADKSSGGNLKSGPEAGEMGGTQQLERSREQRFTEPTQPAR